MADVQPLFGGIIPKQSDLPKIIEILEETLEKAKLGEVRSIALVWIDGGDCIHRDWYKGDKYNSQLLGSIADLQYQFQKAWDEI